MIALDNVTVEYKPFELDKPRTRVLNGVTAVFPPRASVAILGAAASGKTTLLQLLCGLLAPNRGQLIRTGSVSPPVGMVGARGSLTVGQYIHFVARCYSVNVASLRDFTVETAELNDMLNRPIMTLGVEQRARLHLILGYALPFDFYLFDGRVAVGDPAFRQKCLRLLVARSESSGIILATRKPEMARQFCRSGGVLYNGTLALFEDVENAIDYYGTILPASERRCTDVYYKPTEQLSETLNQD